jgi:hypothetical protein
VGLTNYGIYFSTWYVSCRCNSGFGFDIGGHWTMMEIKCTVPPRRYNHCNVKGGHFLYKVVMEFEDQSSSSEGKYVFFYIHKSVKLLQ